MPKAGRTRKSILRALSAEPGTSISDLSRALRIPRTTASYHMRKLEELGEIADLDASGRERVYAINSDEAQLRAKARVVVSNDNTRRVLEYYEIVGSVESHSQIARDLELSHPTVTWHVNRLSRMGLLHEGVRAPGRSGRITSGGRLVLSFIRNDLGLN